MKTKIELVYHSNGRLEKIDTNDDIVFQGSVATSEFYLTIADGDEAWLPTDSVFISFTRADNQKSGQLLMQYHDDGVWKYTSNGWLEDVDLSGNEGEYSVSVMMRRYSPLDNKTVVAVRTSETITLPISPSANWSPKDLTSGEYEAITSAISQQNLTIEKVENFQVGTVISHAGEAGTQPIVNAEIVSGTDPNRYELNMDLTIPQGETGGFGTITASATELSSDAEPTATVTATGTDEAKNLAFQFGIPQGPQGIQGNTGATPNITVNATVDNSVGTPSVEVTQSGTAENPVINLDFKNLKGEQGETVGAVTSVNGETGAVEVTPESIGALPTTGGTITGNVEVDAHNIYPTVNNQGQIGLSDKAWYAGYFGNGGIQSNGAINIKNNAPWFQEHDIALDISATTGLNNYRGFRIFDKNNEWAYTFRGYNPTDGSTMAQMATRSKRSGTDIITVVSLTSGTDGAKKFIPDTNGDVNLGYSNRKWKEVYATTFHGSIEPVLLGTFSSTGTKTFTSLPNYKNIICTVISQDYSAQSAIISIEALANSSQLYSKPLQIGTSTAYATLFYESDNSLYVSNISTHSSLWIYGI